MRHGTKHCHFKTMKSPLTLFPILSAAFIIVGCGAKETPADPAAVGSPAVSATKVDVKNAPDAQAAPGAAYRIVPPDPNDPKFKPDPKLAGGN